MQTLAIKNNRISTDTPMELCIMNKHTKNKQKANQHRLQKQIAANNFKTTQNQIRQQQRLIRTRQR